MSSNLEAKKATKISLFSFSSAAMRAFHMSWLAFFVCFFAWFACAPLMPVIAGEFHLTKDQIANINIAAVAITILVRLIVGPLCDKYGPRKTYTALLVLGSVPVFGVASANSYESFLFFRLLIGTIGASFVITQYHTSIMFAPNVVGTANAASAGWGNAGVDALDARCFGDVWCRTSDGLENCPYCSGCPDVDRGFDVLEIYPRLSTRQL